MERVNYSITSIHTGNTETSKWNANTQEKNKLKATTESGIKKTMKGIQSISSKIAPNTDISQ